jgi:hypothetical protein
MPKASSQPMNVRMTPILHDIRKRQSHLLGSTIKVDHNAHQ